MILTRLKIQTLTHKILSPIFHKNIGLLPIGINRLAQQQRLFSINTKRTATETQKTLSEQEELKNNRSQQERDRIALENGTDIDSLFDKRKSESVEICSSSELDFKSLLPIFGVLLPIAINTAADVFQFSYLSSYSADIMFYYYITVPTYQLVGVNFSVGINEVDQSSKKNPGAFGNFSFIAGALSAAYLMCLPSFYDFGSGNLTNLDKDLFLGHLAGINIFQVAISAMFIKAKKLPVGYLKWLMVFFALYIPTLQVAKHFKDKKIEASRQENDNKSQAVLEAANIIEGFFEGMDKKLKISNNKE